MKKIIFLIIIIIIEVSCFKQNSKKIYFSNNNETMNSSNDTTNSTEIIPVNKKNLELYLGKNYKILEYKITNLDTDIEDELITVTEQKDKNVKISIFDILDDNNIKKRYEYKTNVFYNDDFNLLIHNLFEADDMGIIIEGRSGNNKYWLYIFTFANDSYVLLNKFSGDFFIITDYDEVDPGINKQKYFALDNIVTINNIYSSTNTNSHEKCIYKWDITNKNFKLINKSEVQTSSLSSIDNSITSTKENFFKYILGFWYPIDYLKKIKNDINNIKNINSKNLHFIFFNNKEFSVKKDDYLTKYKITKIMKLWGKKPKLRLKLNNYESLTSTSYKRADITLLSASKIQIAGPGKYDFETFVRLQKPIIEYLNEEQAKIIDEQINKIKEKIKDDFKYGDKFHIIFSDNNTFNIGNGNIKEFGIYQIFHSDKYFIINFIFDTNNTILKNEMFIIDINNDNLVVLTPVKLTINDIKIKNLKSLILYRIQ